MRTYMLITNTSGLTYWSYLGTRENTSGTHALMVAKYGNIYINRKGGWFTQDCVRAVLKTVTQAEFPDTSEEDV